MANIVKHKFVSTKTDSSDTSLVRKTEWNDEHLFAGGSANNLLMRDTGASDGAAWTASPSLTGATLTGNLLLTTGTSFIKFDTGTDPWRMQQLSGTFYITKENVVDAIVMDTNSLILTNHFLLGPTETYDIGLVASYRPRDIHVARDVNVARDTVITRWIEQQEVTTNPTTSDLAADAAVAIYNKADTLVFAYNNAGTMTYLKILLDGSATTWTHNTTAP